VKASEHQPKMHIDGQITPRKVSVPAKIQTEQLLNKSLESHHHTNLFGAYCDVILKMQNIGIKIWFQSHPLLCSGLLKYIYAQWIWAQVRSGIFYSVHNKKIQSSTPELVKGVSNHCLTEWDWLAVRTLFSSKRAPFQNVQKSAKNKKKKKKSYVPTGTDT
jgi:hypothetical protein